MANKHQAEGYAQDEHGWYREPPFPVEQLFDAIDFREGLVWDPFCGVGNILDVARARGHETIGSDIVQRGSRHRFYRSNFFTSTKWPTHPRGGPLHIVSNPTYNVPPGAALRAMLHAIETVPFDRAAFLVPLEFVCGQTRYEELFAKHPPSHVAFCSQRPSMPPGAEVERLKALGDDFKGGKVDFVWIVWTDGGPYRTQALWLRPDAAPSPKSERRLRRGSR